MNAPAKFAPAKSQLAKLDTLINALCRARSDAERGLFFASGSGAVALLAMHDLTEIDAVYSAYEDCVREAGRAG